MTFGQLLQALPPSALHFAARAQWLSGLTAVRGWWALAAGTGLQRTGGSTTCLYGIHARLESAGRYSLQALVDQAWPASRAALVASVIRLPVTP